MPTMPSADPHAPQGKMRMTHGAVRFLQLHQAILQRQLQPLIGTPSRVRMDQVSGKIARTASAAQTAPLATKRTHTTPSAGHHVLLGSIMKTDPSFRHRGAAECCRLPHGGWAPSYWSEIMLALAIQQPKLSSIVQFRSCMGAHPVACGSHRASMKPWPQNTRSDQVTLMPMFAFDLLPCTAWLCVTMQKTLLGRARI